VFAYAPRSRRTLVQFAGGALIVVALIGLAMVRTAAIVGG
jgi:hypothetical protein